MVSTQARKTVARGLGTWEPQAFDLLVIFSEGGCQNLGLCGFPRPVEPFDDDKCPSDAALRLRCHSIKITLVGNGGDEKSERVGK